jgi:hypothetical protein
MNVVKSKAMWTGVIAIIACAIALETWAERGQVLEEGTKRPIAGVYVIAEWRGNIPNPAQPHSVCYHAEVAVTGSDGRYLVPAFSGNLNPAIVERRFSIYLYKPGYRESPIEMEKERIKFMSARTGQRDEQFGQIARLRLGRQCDEEQKRFLPARKAQGSELDGLAETARQRDLVDGLLFGVDELEFGESVAEDRQKQRKLERAKAGTK